MNFFKKITIFCLPCFLLACSAVPSSISTPAPVSDASDSSIPQPIVEPQKPMKIMPVDEVPKANQVVLSLIERANQQQESGNEQAAIASLERAIRIAPRYPESYYLLGNLHYKQGRYALARSLAQKSLSLGADDTLSNLAQSLIERASSAL